MSAFNKLKEKLSHRPNVTSPAGLAAYIGREKLGKKAFQARAVAGRKKHSK